MIFTELRFLLFMAGVVGVYWALPWNTARKVFLLAASLFFYAVWDWRFLFLIVGSTLVDYAAGLGIGASKGWGRRGWLWVSLLANLGALAVFKYFNFFAHSLQDLAGVLGVTVSSVTIKLVLPLGISFYTFEKLSYTIDIYRGQIRPTRNLLDLLLFVCVFPRLVAGPIMRACELLPQFESKRRWASVDARACFMLFLIGYIKKACISDTIGPAADAYFANPGGYTALSGVIGVLLYAAQIYCDFSGYTDMSRACAGLLGLDFVENFRWPYLAPNITDFWRRWHMSLSSWLRDYLYISLGGNRGNWFYKSRNLLLTMLLGGLWHGAAWTFVVWGGLHGLALIVHKEWAKRVRLPRGLSWGGSAFGVLVTFYFVCIAWIFFRSPDLSCALSTVKAFVLFRGQGGLVLTTKYLWILLGLAALHIAFYNDRILRRTAALPLWAYAVVLGLGAALATALTPPGTRPFIYFQF